MKYEKVAKPQRDKIPSAGALLQTYHWLAKLANTTIINMP
jgi:hypothetical protein